jgi:uncharacterized SAM-binding protein YcdF (DUF218 family)
VPFIGELVKDVIPGSLQFLLLGLTVAAVLLAARRTAAWGRRALLALLALYFVLSLQGTSDLLIRGLSSRRPLSQASEARGADTVVVLGNGVVRIQLGARGLYMMNPQTTYNALEAARVYALLGASRIVASGGPSEDNRGSEADAIAAALVDLGVPADRIITENNSHNTAQQARAVAAALRERGTQRFVLVTAPEHMRRAKGVFVTLGLDPIPSPSAIDYGGPPFWRPTRYALQGSHNAIYEYLAWGWYRLRGWA